MRAKEIIGKGRYSQVTAQDPYTVDKTLKKWRKKTPSQDPYPIYAELSQKLSDKNPYFPRIHAVQQGDRAVYTMERLQPLSVLDDETLFQIGKRIISDSHLKYDWKNWEQFKKRGMNGGLITSAMNRTLHTGEYDEIRDPLLAQALKAIREIAQQGDFSPDIHPENIMIRPTSVGPQIVITDPLH